VKINLSSDIQTIKCIVIP